MRGVDAAKRLVAELEKRTLIVNRLITSTGGQQTVTEPLDGEIEINVGGTVLCVPRKPLLLPGVSDSFIAYLLLHHLDGLPKDTDGHPFLDADPIYMDWLCNEVANVGAADAQAETHEIKLTGDHSTDNASLFWHEIFFANKIDLNITRQDRQDADMGEASADASTPLGALNRSAVSVEKALDDIKTAVRQVMDEHQQLLKFHRVMGPFLKSADGQGDEIKGVRLMGKTVSTTEATLTFIGTDKRLYTTFDSTGPVTCISPAHFMKVVDFARRQRVASVGDIVKPPTAPNQRQLTTDCSMYGLTTESVSGPVLWADEMQWIIELTKKRNVTTTLLFKSSRDTFGYQSFLNKVTGKSGLLFALRHGDTHRFGCFIDGQLKPPNDLTQTSGKYDVPLFFYSLSGAFTKPTKIELPGQGQKVEVAGTQGAVRSNKGQPIGKVAIARGRLWLGFARPGPAADLSSCQQWISKDDIPNGYGGEINTKDETFLHLASRPDLTCDEMEVYHLQVNGA